MGVDLNRNYGFQFNLDNIGSNGNPCEEDYRGPHAFSEPETQAVRALLTDILPDVKISVNMHSWGNLFIVPYNYDSSPNNSKLKENPLLRSYYNDIQTQGNLPSGFLFGNGQSTIKYTANGEASDWMLHDRGIIALSPELGVQGRNAETFFPNRITLIQILKSNIDWVWYLVNKVGWELNLEVLEIKEVRECRGAKGMEFRDLVCDGRA